MSTSDTGVKSNGTSWWPSLSADGSRVAFASNASNIDPGDTSPDLDVYVKDLTPDVTAPTTPDGLAATSVSHDEVVLGWAASLDDVGVDHYVVSRDGVEVGTTTETSFTDDTVNPGTMYGYTVVAVDAAGKAFPSSDILEVTIVPAPDKTAPTTPTDLSVTSVTHDQLSGLDGVDR